MIEIKNSDFLLPDTRNVLFQLIDTVPFLGEYVFVGGSALALHLAHRKSEDLDFFTWKEGVFNARDIQKNLSVWKSKTILNLSDQQLDMTLDGVKVSFFDASWPFLEPESAQVFNIASLESLAAMKAHTLFVRAKYRDYYDLYFLVKELGLESVFNSAEKIVDGLTRKIFYMALTYLDDIVDDAIDHLEPELLLDKKQIRTFFEQQIINIESQ
ncbi:MAG: nucleotidyl transferase AbiEii/AbiGii toxin family protein [Natronospirillum sp.]